MPEQHKNTVDYLTQGLSFIFVVLPVSWMCSIFYIILSPIAVFISKLEPFVDELYCGIDSSRYFTASHREAGKRFIRFIREKIIKLILQPITLYETHIERTHKTIKLIKEKLELLLDNTNKEKDATFEKELEGKENYLPETENIQDTVHKKKTGIMKRMELKKDNIAKTSNKILQELNDQKMKIRPFLVGVQNKLNEMKVAMEKYLKEKEVEVIKKDYNVKNSGTVDNGKNEAVKKNLKEKEGKDDNKLTEMKVGVVKRYLKEKKDEIIEKVTEMKEIRPFIIMYELEEIQMKVKEKSVKDRGDDVMEIDLQEKNNEDDADDNVTDIKFSNKPPYMDVVV